MPCIVEANKHRQDEHHACPTCKQQFVGALQMAAAKARVRTTRLDWNFDPIAVTNLANALTEKGNYAQALDTYQKVLEMQQRKLGHNHPHVARTQDNIGNVLAD